MNKQYGFTLVELIVVIAIIAILATIVLINVNTYINKGRDAAIRGDMSTMRTDAAALFGSKGNYYINGVDGETLCDENDAWSAVRKLQEESVCNINLDGTKFCACVQGLADPSNYFCIDSTGIAESLDASCLISCDTVTATCP